MTSLLRNLEWKPSTVSWLSFVLMGLIVAGVGLSGTGHVVDYLEERLTAHGIEHSQEVASALVPRLRPSFEAGGGNLTNALSRAIEDYNAFGYRIFVVDRQRRTVVADSDMTLSSELPTEQSWLAHAVRLGGSREPFSMQTGAAQAMGEDRHPMLIWLQAMPVTETDRWLLGVGRDQKTLTDFMGDLHWHLDAVMLSTYVLITLLGYYAMRSIGRAYERRLESQVLARTRELEAAHEEMLHKARLATIGQTASVLTHEMRNPLASIKLALSGLKGSGNLENRERRRVDLVLGEVDRLDALLSETLDYVRPVKLSANPVVMDALLSQVLKQQEPIMREKGIRLERKVCDDGTATRLDEAQMHQVLLNLLKNAIEASPPGGVIGISLGREGEDLVLEMTNGGDALSPESLRRAFDPFFSTKPKGTGLGLGLVKRVVEEHGGTVELNSDAKTGNRLTLRLPFVAS
ncbi:MAG: ATP-binding protein [Pseudomonadota bacterium]|nr:ATP-binding protein [Pseudomonadota bacterium]